MTYKWLWDVMGLQMVILSPSDLKQHLINRCHSHNKLQCKAVVAFDRNTESGRTNRTGPSSIVFRKAAAGYNIQGKGKS